MEPNVFEEFVRQFRAKHGHPFDHLSGKELTYLETLLLVDHVAERCRLPTPRQHYDLEGEVLSVEDVVEEEPREVSAVGSSETCHEVAAACVCMRSVDHEPPHLCDCGGAWTGHLNGDDFQMWRAPVREGTGYALGIPQRRREQTGLEPLPKALPATANDPEAEKS